MEPDLGFVGEYCHKLVGMTGFEGLASFDIYWRIKAGYCLF